MERYPRLVAATALVAVMGVACQGRAPQPVTSGSASSGTPTPGGTLRLALVSDVSAAFDPQKEYYQISAEIFRCCLLRTLYSTNGRALSEGGTELREDLAAAPPQVSSDGLTWTIGLKPGIRYSPPLQETTVTAADIIRALEREADPKIAAGYSFFYSVIQGFDAFAAGKATTISGLSAPDDLTLVIRLTAPTGDLGWRFSLAGTAPIPPLDGYPMGAANGHTANYGRFLVSTGPYMFQGSEQLDFGLPPDQQRPVAGYVPGRSIVLVRNPSWSPADDDLRPAYADEMDMTIGGNAKDLYQKLDAGEIDLVMDAPPPTDVLRRYSTDPNLRPFLRVNQQGAVSYISMNLATPPFDDLYVRRAMNFAIDKSGLRQLAGGAVNGDIAGHIFPDALVGGLLKDYDPYATSGSAGDLAEAKAEMAKSKYDANGDGICDAAACSNVLALTSNTDPAPEQAALIRSDLEPLGITLDVKQLQTTAMYAKCNDLAARVPICLSVGWLQDYSDAYTVGPPLFSSESLYPGCCNYSALGATPSQLARWGYGVTSVPNVDAKLSACVKLVGEPRIRCWADLDRYLMEHVVPWVPRAFTNDVEITSARITTFSFDELAGIAAYDHLAIAPP